MVVPGWKLLWSAFQPFQSPCHCRCCCILQIRIVQPRVSLLSRCQSGARAAWYPFITACQRRMCLSSHLLVLAASRAALVTQPSPGPPPPQPRPSLRACLVGRGCGRGPGGAGWAPSRWVGGGLQHMAPDADWSVWGRRLPFFPLPHRHPSRIHLLSLEPTVSESEGSSGVQGQWALGGGGAGQAGEVCPVACFTG